MDEETEAGFFPPVIQYVIELGIGPESSQDLALLQPSSLPAAWRSTAAKECSALMASLYTELVHV